MAGVSQRRKEELEGSRGIKIRLQDSLQQTKRGQQREKSTKGRKGGEG